MWTEILCHVNKYLACVTSVSYRNLSVCQVEFADGQSVAQISITVKADGVAETDETISINLTNVTVTGSDYPDQGAVIGIYIYIPPTQS